MTGDEALIGRVLNERYVIEERVARGGMASVFRGTDQRLDREVAIKVMHNGLGDDETFIQRFDREAKAAAKLNHRNVVAVFDQGHDGDVTYLVMEYVPGKTLRALMRDEAPMLVDRALALMAEVLEALVAAHDAHIIHRDIKPENVLITPDGEVRVADFGLARAVSTATTATGGTLIGTVSYIAPEIVLNDRADPRSDVYACGAMLFELLTAVKPHTGDSPIQVAYKHVHEDIAPPSSIRPNLPDYVDALVLRATARDRDQRSADAREFLKQLRLVQSAWQQGRTSDAALAAALMPGPGQPVGENEPTVSVPMTPATTSVDEPTDPRFNTTMQWSSSEWEPAGGAAVSVAPTPAPKPPKGSSRRGRILLIVALLLAVVLAGSGYYLAVGRYVSAPVLVGQSEKAAIKEATDAGFKANVVKREFSETAPLGTVISADPGANARVLPGSTISLVISRGKERYRIPNLQGKTPEEATAALEKLHLKLGETPRRYSEKIEEGRIIRAVDYKVNDEVKRDTVIDLVVSKGREPIDVPDVVGASQAEAEAAIKKVKLKPVVKTAFSDSVAKGIVIKQSPQDGTLFKDEDVTITVSKGPEFVAVPNVRGLKRDEAVAKLKAAGFKVIDPLPEFNYTVRRQSPGGGKKARTGSTITLSPI